MVPKSAYVAHFCGFMPLSLTNCDFKSGYKCVFRTVFVRLFVNIIKRSLCVFLVVPFTVTAVLLLTRHQKMPSEYKHPINIK